MAKRAVKILRTDLQAHPAVQAWRKLHPEGSEPASIEVLQEEVKSHVYRLAGVGPGGSPVVAKGRSRGTLLVERTLHEEVLPQLPLSRLRYYGFVEGDDPRDWLFFEDAGDNEYARESEEHRRLAGTWLGLLHTFAARLSAAENLPDRGPRHYLDHLRSAREIIQHQLDNPALGSTDLVVLKSVMSQLDLLESRWSAIARFCDGMPRTLVHGDFVAKNLRVRITQGGTLLLPLDWETSGWGVPAADLERSVGRSARPDIATYWSIVRESQWQLDFHTLRELANLGTIFRVLAAIRWSSEGLPYKEKPMHEIRIYDRQLCDVMQATHWMD